MKTSQQINVQLDKVYARIENEITYHGMTYEEGVKAALEWVLGDSDEEPIED